MPSGARRRCCPAGRPTRRRSICSARLVRRHTRRTLDVRLVGAEEPLSLAHLPGELRQELESTRGRSPLAVGFVDGRAVSFACAPWQTETLFDLSIDTLEPHRGRGLAAAVAALLIDAVSRAGRQPVWGALEDNGPSLRLAARLGFVPVDRLFVLSRG